MIGNNYFPDGILGLVLGLLFLIWAIVMFFAPFFWYGAWYRAKKIHQESMMIRELLEQFSNRER